MAEPGEPIYVEPDRDRGPRLAHLPVTFFAVVMGVAALSLAWLRAESLAPAVVGAALFWLALALYLLLLGLYLAKVVRHRAAVVAELRHPVRMTFLPTVTISALLLATGALRVAPDLAPVLWWPGAIGQAVLALVVMGAWIGRQTVVQHVTPAWFIPVVGLVVVPLAGVHVAGRELSWAFFAVGVVLWLALLPVVLSRLFLHDQPLPAPLLPTTAVLVAPPAVAALAWRGFVGDGPGEDLVGTGLFAVAVFFMLLVVTQLGRLRRLPFFLSWWAYGFPSAGLGVAVITFGAGRGPWWALASWTALLAVTGLVGVLGVRTAVAVARGRICVPE